ncbi:MAG: mannitol-1-phosphate 5-dehydrogenase [Treponema sp.]|nr:mannitol-1-phosphate 5-dehydrogenase [Treponema sp.]
MKLLQFGAGNIGRSFLGRLFSAAGWEVVFADVDERLVSLLNERRYYTVAIKREGREDERRRVGPVRAIPGTDAALVVSELAGADMVSTSVGKNALESILPLIAGGLRERRRLYGDRPLDIIIAENAREAPGLFRAVLSRELAVPAGSPEPAYPLEDLAGIVETSIGKMVPLMRARDLAADPLLLFAEEYESLIVDKRGFRGPIPRVKNLCPVEPIQAYVDRKLFIHNLGHAAAAYLGYRAYSRRGDGPGNGAPPGTGAVPPPAGIPQVLALPGVEGEVREAMAEAAAALLKEYPGVFTSAGLGAHIEDLLSRFKNTALNDTVYRVGRDLPRKLGREDRLTGAMLLCAKQGLPFGAVARVYRAALDFACPGEDGALFPPDARFREALGGELTGTALDRVLREVSGLTGAAGADAAVREALLDKAV